MWRRRRNCAGNDAGTALHVMHSGPRLVLMLLQGQSSLHVVLLLILMMLLLLLLHHVVTVVTGIASRVVMISGLATVSIAISGGSVILFVDVETAGVVLMLMRLLINGRRLLRLLLLALLLRLHGDVAAVVEDVQCPVHGGREDFGVVFAAEVEPVDLAFVSPLMKRVGRLVVLDALRYGAVDHNLHADNKVL